MLNVSTAVLRAYLAPKNLTNLAVHVSGNDGRNSSMLCPNSPTKIHFWSWPILILVAVLAVMGNLVVIHAIIFVRRFNKPENYMLANLCLNSAILTFIVIFFTVLKQWAIMPYSNWICGILGLTLGVNLPVEAFTIMCMSQERMRMVRRPLERATFQSVVRKVGAIWILSVLLNIPGGFMPAFHEENRCHFLKCAWGNELFGTALAFAVNQFIFATVTQLMPSIIMLRDFCRLAGKLKFLLRSQSDFEINSYIHTRQKLIRNALIFTAYFFIPRIPIFVYLCLYRLSPDILPTEVYCWMKGVKPSLETLCAIHILLYPFLVFFLSTEIRSHVFCCSRYRRRRNAPIMANELFSLRNGYVF